MFSEKIDPKISPQCWSRKCEQTNLLIHYISIEAIFEFFIFNIATFLWKWNEYSKNKAALQTDAG